MNNKIITAALVIVFAAGGFYGGTVYEKNNLTSQGLLRNGNNMHGGNFGGGQGNQSGWQRQGMRNGSPNGGGGFAAGQIISQDDKSITIKTPDGSSKIIFISDTTPVGKTTSGSFSDLSSGQQVMVSGTANSDGSITAQNVQIRPELTPSPEGN